MAIKYYRPYETVTEYGKGEYGQALSDWQRNYRDYAAMMSNVMPALQQMMGYYAPGGGYGGGLRQEAEETVKAGVGRDIATMVSTGMSSQVGARGVQTRASSELSKLYKNIEDTRNQLWMQAVQPYAQMMEAIANIQQTRPTYAQYVRPVTTTAYKWSEPAWT
jgi:hypothetical protein